ncbi:hypothetical protein AgCh_039548 [Apium graveolens]
MSEVGESVILKQKSIFFSSIEREREILNMPGPVVEELEIQKELERSYHTFITYNIVKLLDWGDDGKATSKQTAAVRATFRREFVGASVGTLNIVVKFALDLARGLNYLHSNKIVHRDVKAEYMLLDARGNLKIADFVLARFEALTGETGTFVYMAPETRVFDYIHSQPEINENMRAILVDWLIEFHNKFDLMPKTLYLTIDIIDRYLIMKKVARNCRALVKCLQPQSMKIYGPLK